tara:strand:- start:2043 stop:3146 length:1104 start_codon:yes stop_codon:yes gene_type:complete
MFFYDFPNLLAILIVIAVSFRIGLIPLWLSFSMGLLAFTPFFLNNVLFSPSYMPDQWQYFNVTQGIRSFALESFNESAPVEAASWMLALIPMPYIETIQSLGFFNRLMATILIIWLYSSKNLRGWPLLFMVFYPSLLLYSSLALRDTLVLVFMILSVIFFLENRRLLALLISLPLLLIKFQNFLLIIVFFIAHLYFSKDSVIYRYRYIFVIFIIASLAPFIMSIIEILDISRLNMFIDDGGRRSTYVHMRTIEDFIIVALKSAPYFLMKPLPWEADSFLTFLQSFENILILAFLGFMFIKTSRLDKQIAFKWLVYLFAALAIYGLVVYNFGTAVRYKFPFIVIVIVGMAYELYLKHGKLILNKSSRA